MASEAGSLTLVDHRRGVNSDWAGRSRPMGYRQRQLPNNYSQPGWSGIRRSRCEFKDQAHRRRDLRRARKQRDIQRCHWGWELGNLHREYVDRKRHLHGHWARELAIREFPDPGLVDLIGNTDERANGNAILRIQYSDGSEGILGIGCHGPGAPAGIQEGVIATKGFVTYWSAQPPLPNVDANRTIFHVQ